MFGRMIKAACALSIFAMSTGCAVNRAEASLMADADLSKVKTLYIVRGEKDERGVEKSLQDAFTQRGYAVTTGPAVSPPYPADAAVTYIDKWMWDITMYMLELQVVVRDGKTDFPLAKADSLHTSLTRKSQKEMAEETVANLLAAKH